MQELKVKLVGVAPIMFHNERLANPSDPFKREIGKLTSQKKKTDEIYEQIKKLEWRAGFYENAKGRVVVPSDNVLGCVQNGSRKLKRGMDFNASVLCSQPSFELEYEGPKDWEGLYADGRFCDYRTVVVNRNRTMRARPIFHDWALTIALSYDEEIFNEADLKQCIEIAGERIGLCERRPRCGRFIPEFIVDKKKAA